MQRTSVIEMGNTPKGGRIYLQGVWLLKAGFEPEASYAVDFADGCVTIHTAEDGRRKVSAKQNRTVPVIDIENQQVRDAFAACSKLQVVTRHGAIVITPARTAQLVIERRMSLTEGSMFSGGGLLTEAAASLGFQPRFAVEVDPDYADVYEANHPGCDMFACSVEQVSFEALSRYRGIGLLTLGIPCEPYSRSRHWDRGTDAQGSQIRRNRELPPEAHPNGDMVYWAIRAIEATNPHTVLIEEVPDFLKSGAYFILRSVMERLGYNVDARVIDPVEYGGLTTRKRAVIIGRTGQQVNWPAPVLFSTRTMGDILDPIEQGEWFTEETKPWLFRHWREQEQKGNGFISQKITADSASVGTITKRYFAQQGQHPVVEHPTQPNTYRWLSLAEVKRLHGIRKDYVIGESKTLAGEIIGQGVVVTTMRDIIAANLPEIMNTAA